MLNYNISNSMFFSYDLICFYVCIKATFIEDFKGILYFLLLKIHKT